MKDEETKAKEKRHPRFIDNTPCGEDLFEGKSQERIADQICTILQDDKNCKIVGIDGGWGSGKSNLVKLVENKLRDKNYHFFIYDAWGHQEDLQRRSLLEELTINLTEGEQIYLESKKWKKKLKDLLAKTREVETKTIPKLSLGIIFSVLAIVLTPILSIVTENINNPYLKGGIVALPLLGLICLFLRCYRKVEGRKNNNIKTNSRIAITKLFYIYQNQQKENTTYETISEEEPSVRKFRNWMQDISNDLNANKLVLVFDNMDRLPKAKVQELWSSIHTFFAEIPYENIRVIVPFDREHIKIAFKAEDGINQIDDKNCFGDDFINKTFSVIYRVSPPIMSDWKKYFRIKWNEALGSNEPENIDFNNVVQIYDLLCRDNTPRKIIAFINEFVSIKQVTSESVPDKYIALFILGKHKIVENSIEEILNPSYMDNLLFLYKDDEELPKYIASLFYQIDPERAIQIVFTDQLKGALNNKDTDLLSKISTIPDFCDILENAITEVTNEGNAILALNSIPPVNLGSTRQNQDIWNCLYSKTRLQKDQRLKDFQKILLTKTSFYEKYLSKLLKEYISGSTFIALDYYKSVSDIDIILKNKINVFDQLTDKETVVKDFVLFVSNAKEEYEKYKVYCSNSALEQYLMEQPVEELKNLTVIPYVIGKYDLNNFILHIESLIGSRQADQAAVDILYQRYKELKKPVSIILNDQYIYSYFTSSVGIEDFYFDLIAMRISKLMTFNSSYSPYFDLALNTVEEAFVTRVSEKIEFYMNYDDILLGLGSFYQYPLFVAITKKVTEINFGSSVFDTKSIIENFEMICNNGQLDPKSIILKISDGDTNEINSSNINSVASIFFIEKVRDVNTKLIKHTTECLIEYLDSLSTDKWVIAFQSINSYEFKSSLLTTEYDYSEDAFEAFKIVLKEIADGTISIPEKNQWNNLINRFEAQGKKLIGAFNSIRDLFCREDNMTVQKFSFFGECLFKYAELASKQESLRKILTPETLNDFANADIIINNIEKMKSIIKVAGDDESFDFKDKVRSLALKNEFGKYIDLAKLLGIKLKKDEIKSNANE